MKDAIIFALIFTNSLTIWGIQKTLRIWLPKMKDLAKDAEALKLELWVRQ